MHGTVTYMAPEQCQGHAVDRRADVFSLGVILYELVTGARLFWADNDVASLHRVLSGAVPRPRKLRPELPSALEDILLTAVAHEADRRYPTALELATALELYAAGAGEVIGARWIARMMEDVVGRTQVPWIAGAAAMREVSARPALGAAADAATEAAPRDEGSLVELIAAAGPDEPSDLLFGEPGDERDEAVAPDEVVAPERPRTVAIAEPPHSWLADRRRMLFVAAIAVGVIGGATLMAWLRPGEPRPAAPSATNARAATSPTPPAIAQPATRAGASEPATAANAPVREPPTSMPARVLDEPSTAAPASAGPPSTATSAGRPSTPAPVAPSAAVRTKRRPQPTTRPAPSVMRAAPRAPDEPEHDATAGGIEGRSAAGSAQPLAPPAAKVEWKPTLLLPTDGAPEKRPK
jgi:serine/threonine-protein kinase